jgi:hypothetical protein
MKPLALLRRNLARARDAESTLEQTRTVERRLKDLEKKLSE